MPAPVISIADAEDYQREIRRAGDLLRQAKVVVVPTETMYGAAALVRSGLARLRALRPRKDSKPFVPHVTGRAQAGMCLGPVGELGERMMQKLWPGPVALIFDVPEARRGEVAAQLGVATGDLYDGGNITLRCPDHQVAQDVIAEAGELVAATGAGGGGAIMRGQDAARELGDKVDLVLDAGVTRFAKPSTVVRVRGEGYEIVRQGVYDQRIIDRLLRTTLLFVCSGNTCRSPMAQEIAQRLLAAKLQVQPGDLERKGYAVISAGSVAMSGARATPQAAEAIAQAGGDLSRHHSRALSVELIHQADYIFVMGQSHRQAVQGLVPAAAARTVMLGGDREIDDPIGGKVEQYVELAKDLRTLIEQRLRERKLL